MTALVALLLAAGPSWAQWLDVDGPADLAAAAGKLVACPEVSGKVSNRCLAERDRTVPVRFELPGEKGKAARVFGVNDRKAVSGPFRKAPSKIVIHNGGSARKNRDSWQGRRSGAHYTVDRDGAIYQHHGEELRLIHANDANDVSIGIELETGHVKVGGKRWRCNDLMEARLDGKRLRNPEDLDYVRMACAPSDAQYASLKALVDEIAGRHGIAVDEKGVIGHCEAGGEVHGDPRAFDWDRIGVSKAKKNALFKTRADMRSNCWYYEP